jgi:hypothetical protein
MIGEKITTAEAMPNSDFVTREMRLCVAEENCLLIGNDPSQFPT